MGKCSFCSKPGHQLYITIYGNEICRTCHEALLKHKGCKTQEEVASEQVLWESRRFSDLSQLDRSLQNHPLPRSTMGEAISRRTTYAGCGIFAAGCVYLLVEHEKSFGPWAIVLGIAIAAAIIYEKHLRKESASIISEELKKSKAELERDYERKKVEREERRRDQITRESSRRFSRYKRIVEQAHRKQILLYEYYLYTYPPDWDFRVKLVKERDRYRCRKCSNESGIFHVHHQIRVGAGGTHHISNLVTLCPKCHLDEHPSKRL